MPSPHEAQPGAPGGAPHPMEGLDWEPDAWLVSKALWAASLPLAALRWASIPGCDGLWDRRRRLWTLATPPVGALVFLLQVSRLTPPPPSSSSAATATIAATVPCTTSTTTNTTTAQVEGELGAAAAVTLGDSPFPTAVLLLLLGAIVSGLLWRATSAAAPPRGMAGLVLCGFVMTVGRSPTFAQP